MPARGVLQVVRAQTLGRRVLVSLTVFGRHALSLVNDEQRRWFGMHDRKLDTSEPPGRNSSRLILNKVKITYLSSSASLLMGIPVCIVCMRSTWLLLCLS